MARSQVNLYTCKLRLLQYGLVDEVAEVDTIGSVKGAKLKPGQSKGDDSGDDEEREDDESIMEKRTAYVNRRIKEAKKDGRLDGLMVGAKNPIAAEQRRDLVKTFLKGMNSNRKCANCSGYVFCSSAVHLSWYLTDSVAQNLTFLPEGSLQQNLSKSASREDQTCDVTRRVPGAKRLSDAR